VQHPETVPYHAVARVRLDLQCHLRREEQIGTSEKQSFPLASGLSRQGSGNSRVRPRRDSLTGEG
jgi:hypothetical protein